MHELQEEKTQGTLAIGNNQEVPDRALRLDAAREADRAWQVNRKAYLKRTIPRVGVSWLLVILLCNLAFALGGRAAECVSPFMLRSLGIAEGAFTGFLYNLHVFGVSVAAMALAFLLNHHIGGQLFRWQQTLKQELDTHTPDTQRTTR